MLSFASRSAAPSRITVGSGATNEGSPLAPPPAIVRLGLFQAHVPTRTPVLVFSAVSMVRSMGIGFVPISIVTPGTVTTPLRKRLRHVSPHSRSISTGFPRRQSIAGGERRAGARGSPPRTLPGLPKAPRSPGSARRRPDGLTGTTTTLDRRSLPMDHYSTDSTIPPTSLWRGGEIHRYGGGWISQRLNDWRCRRFPLDQTYLLRKRDPGLRSTCAMIVEDEDGLIARPAPVEREVRSIGDGGHRTRHHACRRFHPVASSGRCRSTMVREGEALIRLAPNTQKMTDVDGAHLYRPDLRTTGDGRAGADGTATSRPAHVNSSGCRAPRARFEQSGSVRATPLGDRPIRPNSHRPGQSVRGDYRSR